MSDFLRVLLWIVLAIVALVACAAAFTVVKMVAWSLWEVFGSRALNDQEAVELRLGIWLFSQVTGAAFVVIGWHLGDLAGALTGLASSACFAWGCTTLAAVRLTRSLEGGGSGCLAPQEPGCAVSVEQDAQRRSESEKPQGSGEASIWGGLLLFLLGLLMTFTDASAPDPLEVRAGQRIRQPWETRVIGIVAAYFGWLIWRGGQKAEDEHRRDRK